MFNKAANYILLFVILAGGILGYLKYASLKNDITFWSNKAAQNFKLHKISESSYEKQIMETNEIKAESETLVKQIKELGRKAVYYENLSLIYKRELGQVQTHAADTLIVTDTAYVTDKRDRFFNSSFGDELFIDGYFQPYSPYNLFITNLRLKSKIDIIVSTDNSGQLFWTIETNSKYLSAENVNVQMLKKSPWRFFAMGNLYFTNFKFERFTGIDLKGGISKGNIGGTMGIKLNFNNNAEYSIGVITFF